MTGKNVLRLIVGTIIAGSLLAVMFSYQVRQNELAVVSQFGVLADTPAGPGLHARWPWPVQKVTTYDVSIQHFEGAYTQLQTQDKQNILLGAYVCWRITDPIQYRKTIVGDLSKGADAIDRLLSGRVGAVVSETPMSSLASLEPGAVQLEAMEKKILDQVAPIAAKDYGIEILRVGIKRTSLPEDVSKIVMENIVRQRQREAQEARSQGQAEAKAITSEADAIAQKVMTFAESRARQIKAQGQASAAAYYEKYGQEEEFAMFLRRLEHLKQTLKVNSMFILDGSQYDSSHGWFIDPPTAKSIAADNEASK